MGDTIFHTARTNSNQALPGNRKLDKQKRNRRDLTEFDSSPRKISKVLDVDVEDCLENENFSTQDISTFRRIVQFSCSSCPGKYKAKVESNPWWTLFIHRCPICHNNQIPRMDIEHPLNAPELDPSLSQIYTDSDMTEAGEDDESDDKRAFCLESGPSHCQESEDDHSAISKISIESLDSTNPTTTTCPSNSSDKCYIFENYICKEAAQSLVILMTHARLCKGGHLLREHQEVCDSVKFLMLHIRDCNRKDCSFKWCRGAKFVLHHLKHCYCPSLCILCSTTSSMPLPLQQLHNQNRIRMTSLIGKHSK